MQCATFDPIWATLPVASLTLVQECANPAYMLHFGELLGAQRLTVFAFDFSRGSWHKFETIVPPWGHAASALTLLAEQRGPSDRLSIEVAIAVRLSGRS